MHWPDEGKNEISYQQQPAPKHQYKTYRDDSGSDGGSTESKSRTKIKKPKTQVYRTQFIFGLKSQKAAAERRRFDVNKFIEKSHGSNHSSLEREVHEHTCSNSSLSSRHILDQENDSSLVSPNGMTRKINCALKVCMTAYMMNMAIRHRGILRTQEALLVNYLIIPTEKKKNLDDMIVN